MFILLTKKKCMKALDFVINRIMSYKKEDKGILFSDYDDRFSFEEIKISMIMKIIQEKIDRECFFCKLIVYWKNMN